MSTSLVHILTIEAMRHPNQFQLIFVMAGTLIGGALATSLDLHTAIWIGASGNALAWLPVAIGPVRTLREVPHVPDETPEKFAETESEALMPGAGAVPQFEEP